MPDTKPQSNAGGNIMDQVADRVRNSENVLVALSNNPSVDELSAALGLTFILDKLGKHATAIFSGEVPNAIEFLEPEKTFEANTNSLQDFIIALDKEKADHLRYKIEGDFVKVYITPYKTTLSEKDLEFSHGDFNVDLIIALNVSTESDLDSALSEYGRIKHDASSINISASTPGKFADLEWGDPGASSVSEMLADLVLTIASANNKQLMEKSSATAFLAGIVAATNRFSNERTTADTMAIASELMAAGADQQLISSSIPVDILTQKVVDANDDATEIVIEKDDKKAEEKEAVVEIPREEPKEELKPESKEELKLEPVEEPVAPKPEPEPVVEAPTIPLKPEPEEKPLQFAEKPAETDEFIVDRPEKVIPAPVEEAPADAPLVPDLTAVPAAEAPIDQYPGAAELPAMEAPIAPNVDASIPEEAAIPVIPADVVNEKIATSTMPPSMPAPDYSGIDPAKPPVAPGTVDPMSPSNGELVAPPLPMPGDGILPPPPAPINFDAPLPTSEPIMPAPIAEPAAPEVAPAPEQTAPGVNLEPIAPIEPAVVSDTDEDATGALSPSMNGINPVMQDQVYADPGAFQIPGM